MHFTNHEIDMLLAAMAADVARRRKARGVRLNYQEAIAFLSDWVVEQARDGKSLPEIIDGGRKVLAKNDVMPGVPEMIGRLEVEATFPDGTRLVVIDNPIR